MVATVFQINQIDTSFLAFTGSCFSLQKNINDTCGTIFDFQKWKIEVNSYISVCSTHKVFIIMIITFVNFGILWNVWEELCEGFH